MGSLAQIQLLEIPCSHRARALHSRADHSETSKLGYGIFLLVFSARQKEIIKYSCY